MKILKDIAISDSGLVFNPDSGEFFSTNPIGIEIINMIREGKSEKEISAAILKRYTAEPSIFENDLQDFIGILRHFNLLEKNEEKKA